MSSMFSSNDPDTFELLGLTKKDGGGEKRTIRLVDNEGVSFSLENLKEEIKTTMKERKDELDKVLSFGAGLLNNSQEAFGFMMGWLTSRIISAYEKSTDTQITIQMESKTLNREEVIENTIEEIKSFLAHLEENKNNPELMLRDVPHSPIKSDLDGTEGYE